MKRRAGLTLAVAAFLSAWAGIWWANFDDAPRYLLQTTLFGLVAFGILVSK